MFHGTLSAVFLSVWVSLAVATISTSGLAATTIALQGAGHPVTGATVQLFAAGTTGYGDGATVLRRATSASPFP
ncbi:hypothetical protein [Granulicella arctica]|uniref:hypothetical protein n=1 Tax=Granulicella arctica TaxID=940613 RepID=UPI0021DFD10C|nr:hypothetical protein [Granulicella arctica]